ncbi:hypothetical protein ACFSTD_08810 [Novosphingobium colocasiae]
MKASTTQRHYGMDWLRIGAFVLLIFYHIGINFTPWGYTTPTRGVVPWAEIPLLATSAWRLGLLFAISGYSSAALLAREKSDGAFLRSPAGAAGGALAVRADRDRAAAALCRTGPWRIHPVLSLLFRP